MDSPSFNFYLISITFSPRREICYTLSFKCMIYGILKSARAFIICSIFSFLSAHSFILDFTKELFFFLKTFSCLKTLILLIIVIIIIKKGVHYI